MKRLDLKHLQKRFHKFKLVKAIALGVILLNPSGNLTANPQNPTVVAGSATFNAPSNSTLQINAGHNTIINWDKFSIDAGELTSFLQPSSSSAVLNRVTGNELSNILGNLQSNGKVFLINQNGILIGQGAIINTGSFVASTLDVLDSDFLAGNDLPFIDTTKNGIVNKGTIQSTAGDIVLLGYTVDNQGTLSAPQGGVHFGAGSELILQINGPEKIVIQTKQTTDPKSQTGIQNSGTINSIVAELKADGNPYAYGINHQGQINATGIVSENGQIFLRADNSLSLVAGTTKAINQDNTGGNITILGEELVILDNAIIDASGDHGGGTILIGGGYQGNDPLLPNANQVLIEPTAQINANANLDGNGGTIVHWADSNLFHYGKNNASGGINSGNGGLVEASGKQYLDYQGTVDLSAPNGTRGTLLLDPTSLIVKATGPDTNVTASSPFFPSPTPGTTAILTFATLSTALGSGDVLVQTGLDGGVGPGDITWLGSLTLTTSSNLTLNSANNIIFNGITDGITGSSYTNNGSGNLTLVAVNDINFLGGSGPGINQSVSLTTTNFLSIHSLNGNVNLEVGQGIDSGVSLFAKNIDIQVDNGSLSQFGGSNSTNYVYPFNSTWINASGGSLNISTGLDYTLQGCPADLGMASAFSHILNLNIGGNLILQGGSIKDSNSALIFSDVISGRIGNDLILTGGSSTGSKADLFGAQYVNLSVGNNLLMTSGSGSSCFARIGANYITPSKITLSNIGGEVLLDATNGGNESYCLIGMTGSSTKFQGDIILNGSGNSPLKLISGSNTNTFAQIGHFTTTDLSDLSGDITLSGFGDIYLTPNSDYTSIGHRGMQTVTAGSNPSGNISILNNSGSINLNGGTGVTTPKGYSLIGHQRGNTIKGNITIDTIGDINVLGSTNTNSIACYSQIGHTVGTSVVGDINIKTEGNLFLTGGVQIFDFALVGHSNSSVDFSNITGNILITKVGGDLKLTGGASSNTNAQIAHLQFPSSNATHVFTTTSDVFINEVGGSISLTGGTVADSPAIIGFCNFSPFSIPASSLHSSGQVVVNSSNSINLNAGSGLHSDAIIGFGKTLLSPSYQITSPLVQVTANGPITLNAGNRADATIGYSDLSFNRVSANIDQIHVTSSGGNISLNGGISFSSLGGIASIGTLAPAGSGTISSSIKVTTPFEVQLKVSGSNTGQAIISNNSFGIKNGLPVNIDPTRIILLGSSGNAITYSSGDLSINVTEAFDINFDPANPNAVYNGNAIVEAQQDILINTTSASYPDIHVGNTTSTTQAKIISDTGDIFIGTPNEVGADNLTLQGTGLISTVSTGDIYINVAHTLNGSGATSGIIANAGEITIDAGLDILTSGNFGISAFSPNNITLDAGRYITMGDSSFVQLTSTGILKLIAQQDITVKNLASVSVKDSGDLYMIADRNIYLNDSASVTTSGGHLNLVVDNAFPTSPLYGTGKLVKDHGVFVNADGGTTRIFTSRQPFNSIIGTINGSTYIPGTQYVNTSEEQWGTYFETATLGNPFTIFYKDGSAPPAPTPHLHPSHHSINDFVVALSEALQEWRTLDELHLVPVQFCNIESWTVPNPNSDFAEDYYHQCYERCFTILRKELVTYNTKLLLDILRIN